MKRKFPVRFGGGRQKRGLTATALTAHPMCGLGGQATGERLSRHYYDLAKLFQSPIGVAAISVDYQAMQENLLFGESYPFDELMALIGEIQAAINSGASE